MRQVVEIRELPQCKAPGTGWFGRLRIRLFGAESLARTVPLERSSEHLLRDIGLLDYRRGNDLLRDDVFFRR